MVMTTRDLEDLAFEVPEAGFSSLVVFLASMCFEPSNAFDHNDRAFLAVQLQELDGVPVT